MFLLGLLCIGAAVAVFCHDLPIGKQLRSLLIDAPARFLSKLSWAKVLVTVALLTFFVGAVFIGANMHDGMVVFMMLPEVMVWIAAFDIATLLELALVAVLAAASIRLDSVAQFVTTRVAALAAPKSNRASVTVRERRSKPRRPNRGATDGDAAGLVWGCAFA